MKKFMDPHNTKFNNPKMKRDGITYNIAFSLFIIPIFIVQLTKYTTSGNKNIRINFPPLL